MIYYGFVVVYILFFLSGWWVYVWVFGVKGVGSFFRFWIVVMLVYLVFIYFIYGVYVLSIS